MKKVCCLLVAVFCTLLFVPVERAWAAADPQLSADAAVLLDYQSGVVLYSFNATEPLPPASTTKILAGLLSLEVGDGNDTVEIDQYSASTEGTSLYLKAGQKYSLYDITKGALINSGNDAAAAIAVYLAGSEEQFASLMNYKARTIGCWQNCFCNPHGLSQTGHQVSALDLAKITRYALHNKDFRQIVGTRSDRIDELSGDDSIELYNTNRLLGRKEGDLQVVGVKTGTTDEAGQCLVAAAQYHGQILLSVVLGSGDRYTDTLRLFQYGTSSCYYTAARGETPLYQVPVKWGANSTAAVGPAKDIAVFISPRQLPQLDKKITIESELKAPCKKGDPVGRVEISVGNSIINVTELVILEDVDGQFFWMK